MARKWWVKSKIEYLWECEAAWISDKSDGCVAPETDGSVSVWKILTAEQNTVCFQTREEKSCLEIYKSEKQLANCQLKLVSNKNGCTLSFCCHDVSFYLLCDFGHKELVRQCILGKKSSYPDHFLMGRRCKIIHSKSNFPVIRFWNVGLWIK